MKRVIIAVLLTGMLTASSLLSAGTVVFTDSRVEAAVRRNLELGAGAAVTDTTLRRLTALTLESPRSLKGLEHAVNLRVLSLEGVTNAVVYKDLKRITSLHVLKISLGEPITSFSFLEGLSRLRKLNIYHRKDSKAVPLDFVHLRHCRDLQELHLQGYVTANIGKWATTLFRLEKLVLFEDNPLPNLEFFRALPRLNNLVLMGLKGNDLLPLGVLHRMEDLWLNCKGSRGSTDFLKGMTRLKKLAIYNVEDSRGLRYLKQNRDLYKLDLCHMELRDLDFLRGLTELRQLSANNNAISDIKGLSDCRKLRFLDLSRNSLTDISPLAGLPELSSVDLDYNNIKDFRPLHESLSRRDRDIFFRVKQNGADFRPGSDNFRRIQALLPKCRYRTRQEKEYKAGNFWQRGQLFADAGLEKAVRSKVGITSGPIPVDRYASVKKLRYGGNDFSRLEGIERLTGLESFETGMFVVDVLPLNQPTQPIRPLLSLGLGHH